LAVKTAAFGGIGARAIEVAQNEVNRFGITTARQADRDVCACATASGCKVLPCNEQRGKCPRLGQAWRILHQLA